MPVRKIDPLKLSEKLKPFKTDYIVKKAGNRFTKASVSGWAAGKWMPSPENALALCHALDCDYEEISSEVTLSPENAAV